MKWDWDSVLSEFLPIPSAFHHCAMLIYHYPLRSAIVLNQAAHCQILGLLS
jgi:hypothetical protein